MPDEAITEAELAAAARRAEAAEAKLAAIAQHRNAACAALRIAETQARYPAGDEATADRYRAAREALEGILAIGEEKRPCSRCDGCGQLADSDARESWTSWTRLPLESSAAVLLGLVKPIPCDVCGGTGRA